MVICTRPGCGADSSSPGPCKHHPGVPVFHEGLKSWSCCNGELNKPVLEFDQFLALPPCAEAAEHSDVKPKKKEETKPNAEAGVGVEAKPASTPTPAPTKGDAAAPLTGAALASAQALLKPKSNATTTAKPAEPKPEEEDPPEADASLSKGTPCKRAGCKATFEGEKREREKETCRYHKGVAVFHEGSKGYTCCKRRVLDFADFLTIEPCTLSTHGHLFAGASSAASTAASAPADGIERVQCRMDHYETPSQVHVTVYAKGVEKETSVVEFKDTEIRLKLSLPPSPTGQARLYERALLPFAPIDPATSSFTLTKFKLEMVLQKQVKGQSWPTLESGEQAFGFGNTFGRS